MKNLFKLAALTAAVAVSASAFAATGAYVGVNAGYGKVNQKVTSVKKNDKGLAWGLNGGYMFTQNVGVEVGYTKLAKSKYDSSVNQSAYNVYLAAKGVMPINQQFDVFGKLGVASVHTKSTALLGTNTKLKNSAVVPMAAIGAAYNLNQNVSLNVQAMGTAKKNNKVPAMYALTAGVAYKF